MKANRLIVAVVSVFVCASAVPQACRADDQPDPGFEWAGPPVPSAPVAPWANYHPFYHPMQSYNNAPSPQQLAQQRANAAARVADKAGCAAYDKDHDWATAAADFQNALRSTPNDPVILANLAAAYGQEGIAAMNRGDYAAAVNYFQLAANGKPSAQWKSYLQEELTASKQQLAARQAADLENQSALDDMKADIADFALQPTKAAVDSDPYGLHFTTRSSSENGLNFMEDGNGGRQTAPGALDTHNAAPGLSFVDPGNPQLTGTAAGDQLVSAVYHGDKAEGDKPLDTAKDDSNRAFDTPGEEHGAITPANIPTPASNDIPVIPPALIGNQFIQQDLKNLSTWGTQLNQAQAEVAKAQADVNSATTPEAKAAAQGVLGAAQGKMNGLEDAVESAKKDIQQQIFLSPFKVGPPAVPGNPNNATASGSKDQQATH